ncbi:MAG: hypothetical protein WC842_01600 [Candidatus Paceibacterota bacterium]
MVPYLVAISPDKKKKVIRIKVRDLSNKLSIKSLLERLLQEFPNDIEQLKICVLNPNETVPELLIFSGNVPTAMHTYDYTHKKL